MRRRMTSKWMPVCAALVLLVVPIADGACQRGRFPTVRSPWVDTADVSSITADSALFQPQPNCRVPLTGLLHTNRADHNRWAVKWQSVATHLATLQIEADSGEKNHVLQPVERDRRVAASIAPIKGTETLSEEASLEALRCGRVIAQITSSADHAATMIKAGVNYLVIAMTQPMDAPNRRWIFVIINPARNYRASLKTFKFTPHYSSYGMPTFPGLGGTLRASVGTRPLSAKAEDCRARKLKACFIDPVSESFFGDGDGDGAFTIFRGSTSEPWVPCPLYGCCCGGDECHDDGVHTDHFLTLYRDPIGLRRSR